LQLGNIVPKFKASKLGIASTTVVLYTKDYSTGAVSLDVCRVCVLGLGLGMVVRKRLVVLVGSKGMEIVWNGICGGL
jgi:hypothetical protein